MSVVTTAAALVAFPVLAAITGSVVAVLRKPSAALVSGVQHLAAGVVVAAVAGEVLPDLRERGSLGLVVVGFAAAVAFFVFLQRFEADEPDAAGTLPVAFLVVVGIDLLIDGLLVGAGAAVSTDTAVILTIALTVEVLFIGLALSLQLAHSGVSKIQVVMTTAGLSLLVAVGAVLGALVLDGAGNTVLVLVLAFAAAALLWLVVEELLVEAHQVVERPWMSVMFFVGFLAIFSLEALV
ncbi:MAG: ZIP family metal transporter [Mycobacterium sp.]